MPEAVVFIHHHAIRPHRPPNRKVVDQLKMETRHLASLLDASDAAPVAGPF